MPPDPKKTTLLIAILLFGMAMTLFDGISGPGTFGTHEEFADPAPPPIPLVRPGLSVFFTDSTLEEFRGGPETGLIAAVDAARVQVDIAAYDLDLWGLRDALVDAQRRGVRVRVVLEADQADTPEVNTLVAAGIPIVTDRPEGLMHDKFVIIDRRQVWTGSMNFTLNGAYRNDNHLLAIDSKDAAEIYQGEFEEMFTLGLFGAFSPVGGPRRVELDTGGGESIRLEILFSPDDGVEARLLELVVRARSSIRFMAFSFTSDALGEALLERAGAGVLVSGIFDESQLKSNRGSEYDYLKVAGLAVRIDGNRDKLHHKVLIIDEAIVIAGSYNFSASAETRNDENLLVIHSEEIAGVFLEEWTRVFEAGR